MDDMENAETKTIGQWQVGIGCVVAFVVVVLVLIIWFERKNVAIVIEMLKEASYALSQLPATLCTPIYFSIFALIFTFGCGLLTMYIYCVKLPIGPNPMPQRFIDSGMFFVFFVINL